MTHGFASSVARLPYKNQAAGLPPCSVTAAIAAVAVTVAVAVAVTVAVAVAVAVTVAVAVVVTVAVAESDNDHGHGHGHGHGITSRLSPSSAQLVRLPRADGMWFWLLDWAAVSDETPAPSINLDPLPGQQTGANLPRLVGLMQRLLAPDGCPWDREQTLATLLPYLVEETYEVVDALAAGNVGDHCEELGDLLLQIVFQAELRHKEGAFGIEEVIEGIVRKLVRRHPHVFGDIHAKNSEEALASWAKLKATEKAKKGKKGALDGIPASAPALIRAMRAGEKAGAVGFDWPDAAGVRDKVNEELAEFDQACASQDRTAMSSELGDLLFAVVNLARKLDLDAEHSLREATDRFGRRFAYMEERLAAEDRTIKSASTAEQNELWEAAKKAGVK